MKKILISLFCLVMCVAICGCSSTSSTSAISSLSSQLDETANTISSVETVSPTTLGSASENLASTQDALMREEWNKAQILARTAEIKNALSEETSLSKDEVSALKELTNNLNKYTLSVAYTKNDLDSTLKSISTLAKNEEKNADKLGAKLNRLTCSSNARSTYYENILATLDQIDAYLSSGDESGEESEESEQNETQQQPYYGYNSNNINRAAYGAYGGYGGYGGYGNYGGYGAVGNGYGGAVGMNEPYAFNGGYAYPSQNIGGMPGTRFNLNRNTDTYAPMMRNVDTYQPTEERLEETEEIGEDNTLHSADEEKTSAQNAENSSLNAETEESQMTSLSVQNFERKPPKHFHQPSDGEQEFAQSEELDRAQPKHLRFKKPQMSDEENVTEENFDQSEAKTKIRETLVKKFAPKSPTSREKPNFEEIEKSQEQDERKQIQPVEPQTNLQTSNQTSKLKSVSSAPAGDGEDDWNMPIRAHESAENENFEQN